MPVINEPKYSVLSINEDFSAVKEMFLQYLNNGIKIILLQKEQVSFPDEFKKYCRADLLFFYHTGYDKSHRFIDGDTEDIDLKDEIYRLTPKFNVPQYLVEHCRSTHQIVEASAGTGKTKVMIDRILYLLHTQDDLSPSDIIMITFTNKATNQMNERLQSAFVKRYDATGCRRYLTWLEQQSQMRISTIDSFALELLGQYGTNYGFNTEVSIRSYKHDIDELMKDAMDAEIDIHRPIYVQTGLQLYQARKSMMSFWRKLINLGYGPSEILDMEWGNAEDLSHEYQKLMLKSLSRLESAYVDLKRKMNAVSVEDTLRDLSEILKGSPQDVPDLRIRYLFIDEFQDSDNSQIRTVCNLAKVFDTHLFIVGDIKQSIYRFRGASDSAFDVFKSNMKELGLTDIARHDLRTNYRSSPMIIDELNKYFAKFKDEGLLNYDVPAEAFHEFPGAISFIELKKDDDEDEKLLSCIISAKKSLEERLNGEKPRTGESVAVLVRTNNQLSQVAKLLESNRIHAIMKRQGSFFNSQAVRDVYLLVSSFVFVGNPISIFNYLVSPYSDFEGTIDIKHLHELQDSGEDIRVHLRTYLDQTEWRKWDERFRTQPVLSTLQDLIQQTEVWNRFAVIRTKYYIEEGWAEEEYIPRVKWETNQYRANLNKLLIQLQRNVSGNSATIYKVYSFLRINIMTNREEEEAELVEDEEEGLIQCMTVHGAKGLEFDTVIMPYTSFKFNIDRSNNLIISNDNQHVGWKINEELHNENYPFIWEEEKVNTRMEECRLLYVALTRAMRNLVCFLSPPSPSREVCTWTDLLRRCNPKYEVIGEEFNHTWDDLFRGANQ